MKIYMKKIQVVDIITMTVHVRDNEYSELVNTSLAHKGNEKQSSNYIE